MFSGSATWYLDNHEGVLLVCVQKMMVDFSRGAQGDSPVIVNSISRGWWHATGHDGGRR